MGRMADLDEGTMVATKAMDISAFVTAFAANTKPQKESTELIANAGQQSADITGSAKFDGNIDLNLATALLLPLVNGVIGSAAQIPLDSSDWATATVTTVGTIVASTTSGYFVAMEVRGDATTGAVEPTGATDYENLPFDGADENNCVIWKFRDMLYKSTGHVSGFCTDKFFFIERVSEGCGSSNVFDTIALNVELTTLNIEKSDGTISQKQSIPWFAAKTNRSTDDDYKDITVTTESRPTEMVYVADDVTVRVDTEKYGTVHNFKLPYNRTVKQVDSVEPGVQIVVVGAPTLAGDLTLELDPEEYAIVQKSSVKSLAIVFNKGDGESAVFTYPESVFDEPEIQTNASEPKLMNVKIKPTGNSSQYMATVDVITATVY